MSTIVILLHSPNPQEALFLLLNLQTEANAITTDVSSHTEEKYGVLQVGNKILIAFSEISYGWM